ncbi:MAG: lipid IV(A) 3-deoxy-D-manno-octulosonic acid transferase [Pseudomonadales bacterium]|nr:lipid IV(A) 3-deoxy-D-manno-octulosonic acid transferase [Pseudomonadales bacterium]
MARRLYSLFFYLCLPLIFTRLLLRSRHAPAYRRRLAQRLGYVTNAPKPGGIWIHAVSVGETLAAVPLVKRLQRDYPDLPIAITTMTPTGSEQVRKNFSDTVFHTYIPYDVPTAVRRLLSSIKPQLLLVMETELWPNLVDQCQRREIPVLIANARLSARSAKGYGRLDALVRPMMKQLSLVVAQSDKDQQRLIALGMDAAKVTVGGNIKFDISLTTEIKEQSNSIRAAWGLSEASHRKVLIAASTHEGEEQQILAAFQQMLLAHPSLLLLLVPRHPERFGQVEQLCLEYGLNTKRRSNHVPCTDDTQVMIGDTMGELMAFYGVADIAFVGGSLVETGGHNLLEPAVWQLPTLSGQHLFNFAEVDQLMSAANALIKVNDAAELAQKVGELLNDPKLGDAMGKAAFEVVQQNRGSMERLYSRLTHFIEY